MEVRARGEQGAFLAARQGGQAMAKAERDRGPTTKASRGAFEVAQAAIQGAALEAAQEAFAAALKEAEAALLASQAATREALETASALVKEALASAARAHHLAGH